jgi:integrase
MSKRKNGEGTWGVKSIKGVDYKYYRKQYEGMSTQKYFYGKTEKEIKDKIKEFEKQNRTTNSKEISKISFGEYIENWLINIKQSDIKRRTYDGYEDTIKNQILNYNDYDLSSKQIGTLDKDIFREYYKALAKKYSRAALQKNRVIINQCLDYAVEENHIADNFVSKIKLPSEDRVAIKKKDVPFLSQEDMDKIYDESKRINTAGFNWGGKIGEKTYGINSLAIVLMMYTGLRVGELTCLRYSDWNKATNEIIVRNNLSTIKNRDKKSDDDNNYIRVETTVKTDESERVVPLCDIAIEMLNEFEKLNPNHKPDDFIVINKLGNVAGQRNLTRTLNAMLVRAGCEVQKCGLHSLRSSFGSYLILKGADIKVVSELMGHSDTQVTYNHYIKILPKQHRSAIDLFNKKKDTE